MSGDHGTVEYDEVNVMKRFAIARGVPSSDGFMDHAGFSTWESMYRARDVFGVRRVVIVTQGYHLPRALWDARALGLEAWGVASEPRDYGGQSLRDIREAGARLKDFFYAIFQPEPTFLGDLIPIGGDGNLTND
jgi:vancomycin permeability regulator SanA